MPEKVLVVDPCAMIRRLLSAYLVDEQVEIHFADDGPGGINAAIDLEPDLILLDVELGVLSGFEVCRRLKEMPRTSAIPVIFLTSQRDTKQKVRGLDCGAVDYVTKPFDSAELIARVRAALRTKRVLDLLATRAQLDALTGLWNRAHLEEELPAIISHAARHRQNIGCMMIDVDYFKKINDTHGHPVGDRVLQFVGQTVRNVSRLEDLVCRYGGEEFAVVMQDVDSPGVVKTAERIRSTMCRLPFRVHGTDIIVTVSIGVAVMMPGGDPAAAAHDLITQADVNLYRAKQAGRNRVVAEIESVKAMRYKPPAA